MYNQSCTNGKLYFTLATLSTAAITCTRDTMRNHAAAVYMAASKNAVMPVAIAVPAGNTQVPTYSAASVQKYKARKKAGSTPAVYKWAFVPLRANFYDATNKKMRTHGARPFRQLSVPASIFAQHFNPAKTAPSPDAEGVDWLLLMSKTGTAFTGVFANVAYIRRMASKHQTTEAAYETVYRFTKKNL